MNSSAIAEQLAAILPPHRIRTRYIDRIGFAADAGFYSLVPRAVVQPMTEAEIGGLFRFSHQHRIPLVFRTGGTSLSGQSITDGILVDLSRHWGAIQVEAEGARVRVQPGVTGALVNSHLQPYRRKIGPDPASISAAMMGGILSNNASGMCCGVALNSYHTTQALRFILPNGMGFSTEEPQDYGRFQAQCPELAQMLAGLRRQVQAQPALRDKIRHKYRTKTTVGYSLNAFLDFERPLDILAHLLIGAEGTLAFIAEAVLATVPDYPCKSTALLYFTDIVSACQAIGPLAAAGAAMVELMDRASLRAVEQMPGMPAALRALPATAAALLVEFQETDQPALAARVAQFQRATDNLALLNAPVFTEDPAEQTRLWKMRKGLFPAVGAVRASGTTVILEDVAFPVESLGPAILDLQALFAKYGYREGIIFGHAKDGNLHFVVTQTFASPAEIERYDRFLREVVDLVVNQYGGTLKAEHGTGRNMAPFVQTEWGSEAYAIMQSIKKAIDPEGLLNPGVILNPDESAHLKNLKALPAIEAEVDRCIECGLCEPKCPSRDLTTSPRRRIVVRRALKTLQLAGETGRYRLLRDQFQYDGLATCAVDGLCATACPVEINTGELVKRLRRESHSVWANRAALWTAHHFGVLTWAVRTALRIGHALNHLLGQRTMERLTASLRRIVPALPRWSAELAAPPDLAPLRANRSQPVGAREQAVVYFPSCITRMLGTYPGKQKSGVETFLSICHKAGIAVLVPPEISGSCCSQIYAAKGFAQARAYMANQAVRLCWESSAEGRWPVVVDVSSCAQALQQIRPLLTEPNRQKYDRLRFLDSVDFLHDTVLPLLPPRPRKGAVVLHPGCSLEKAGTVPKLVAIARHFAQTVTVPRQAGCCGMAGDRGLHFPELTAVATAGEAAEVRLTEFAGYYATNRACEMALSAAVQKTYVSILYLVDEAL